jgi:hypothetical protein
MRNEDNHWITCPVNGIVAWHAVFPGPRGDIENFLTFGAKIVDAGKAHRVWDMHRYAAGSGAGETFESHLRSAALRGALPLFLRRREDPEPSGTVAVYGADGVREVVTSDLGALLSELRPSRYRRAVESAPPVVVKGGAYDVNRSEEIWVSVRLNTDIWFSRVCGLFEDTDDDADELPESYDNHEIAMRHTPRFNAFLREVQAATLVAGGTWAVEDAGGISINYKEWFDVDGIVLP